MSLTRKIGLAGVVMLVLVVALAGLGPFLVPYSSTDMTGGPLQPPGGGHLLGTNDMGHDIMAELVEGARVSLFIGIASAIMATLIGSAIGLIAGYLRGWADALFMRIVDVSLTLPFLPLMIVIGVYLGPSIVTQIFIITLVMWARKAREIRSQVLMLRSRGPVLAAQSMGAGPLYLLWRHMVPEIVPLVIPQFVRAVNAAIMLESSLSFLGLGDPLSKSWGSILFYANARSAFLTDAWLWWVLPPGLCIVVTVLSFSFIGYWLEERVSPRLRSYVSEVSAKRAARAVQPSPARPASPTHSELALEVRKLSVAYPKGNGVVKALDDVAFSIRKGEVLGIVGESGSGKTTVAGAVMRMLKPPADVKQICIDFGGIDLALLSAEEMRLLRGNRIALIPQAAMNALNPVLSVRSQLEEAILTHRRMDKKGLRSRVDELLGQVGLTPAAGQAYPHELSGGMRQRVVIAMALMNEPELVIADEPTTGLDVQVQVEIIRLLEDLQRRRGLSMIFISHDLPVVLRLSDRVIIMKDGKIVDQGQSDKLVREASHPYTRRLIDSIPRLPTDQPSPQSSHQPSNRAAQIDQPILTQPVVYKEVLS